jgi:ethanolamine ammonia-lyase small subunit
LPASEVLRFAAAHAEARDAVHVALDAPALECALQALGRDVIHVHSRALDRADYLLRPDHGRMLAPASVEALRARGSEAVDLALVVADGLSALAAQRHAPGVLEALLRRLEAGGALRIGPVVVATMARVALADEIGALLGARLSLILLGERPGLAAPDSLGAYLTWAPAPGRVDAQRNCVSNIRPDGQPAEVAAARLAWLVREALHRGTTGIALKDESEFAAIGSDEPPPAIDA